MILSLGAILLLYAAGTWAGSIESQADSFESSGLVAPASVLFDLATTFTAAAWVTSGDADFVIARRGDTTDFWSLEVSGGSPYFQISNNGSFLDCLADVKVDDGVWHYVTGVRVATDRILLFVDDTLSADCSDPTFQSPTLSIAGPLEFLAVPSGSVVQIDEIRVWNVPQDLSTVKDVAYRVLTTSTSALQNLLGYWRFEEIVVNGLLDTTAQFGSLATSTLSAPFLNVQLNDTLYAVTDSVPLGLMHSFGASAADSLVVGPGLTGAVAGVPARINITLYDKFLNPLALRAGESLSLVLSRASQTLSFSNCSSSVVGGVTTYSCVYTLTVAAVDWALAVQLLGRSSPLVLATVASVTITAAAPAAGTLSGLANTTVAGVAVTMRVDLVDSFANPATLALTQAFILNATSLAGFASGSCSLVAGAIPPRYSCSVAPTLVGTWNVALSVVDTSRAFAVTGTRASFTVTPAAFTAGPSTLLPLAVQWTAGVAGNATLQTRDTFGNDLTTAVAGTNFTLLVRSPNLAANFFPPESAILMTYIGNGQYFVSTLNMTVAGVNQVQARAGTTTVSTLSVTVSPASASPLSTLSISNVTVPASLPLNLTITAIDAFGNQRTAPTPAQFVVTIALSTSNSSTSISPVYVSGAQWAFTFAPAGVVGVYTLTLSVIPTGALVAVRYITALGPATATQLSVDNGVVAGGTAVTITGSNFIPALSACYFGGISAPVVSVSPTSLVCTTRAAAAGVYNVTVTNDGGLTLSSPLSFTQVTPAPSSISPTAGLRRGGLTVQITGTGFVSTPRGSLRCIFGTFAVNATFLSSTLVECVTPSVTDPGTYRVRVSNNGIEQSDSFVNFQLVEPASEMCRTTDELSVGIQDRLTGNYLYFPNLAVDGSASMSSPGFGASEMNPQTLLDGDRCCYYTPTSLGYHCGLHFPFNTTGLTHAVVVLPRPAFVNQFITSWYDPCVNEPSPALFMEHRDLTTGNWVTHARHFTDATYAALFRAYQRPCYTIPSDDKEASLCIDYFDRVTASEFRVSFNNTAVTMSPLSAGAWMFEFEVHGIYVDDPYSLTATPQGAPTIPPVPSAVSAALPDILVTVHNLINDRINATVDFTVSLERESLPGVWEDISFLLSGNTYFTTSATGDYTVQLALLSPTAGSYRLLFQDAGSSLQRAEVPFTVIIGAPISLLLYNSPTEFLLASSPASVLPSVTLRGYDAGGSFVGATDRPRNISVALTVPGSATLGGTLLVTMQQGQVTFSNIQFINPVISSNGYVLSFSDPNTPAISVAQVYVAVSFGTAVRLRGTWSASLVAGALEVPSNLGQLLPALNVAALDSAGNTVTSATRVILVDFPFFFAAGQTVMANGVASLDFLQLALTPQHGLFNLTVSSAGLVSDILPVRLVIGSASSLRVIAAPSSVFPSAPLVSLVPPIVIRAFDDAGVFVNGSETTNPSCSAQAFIPLLTGGLSVYSSLVGTITVTMVAGQVVFSDLGITNPHAQAFDVTVNCDALFLSTSFTVTVVPGTAVYLADPLNPGGLTTPGYGLTVTLDTPQVPLPPIEVQTYDAGANPLHLIDSQVHLVTASLSTDPYSVVPPTNGFVLSGTTQVNATLGSARFNNLRVSAAPIIPLYLHLTAPGLVSAVRSVTCLPGSFAHLQVVAPSGNAISIPSAQSVVLAPTMTVYALDVGGNFLSNVRATVRVSLISGIGDFTPVLAPMEGGVAYPYVFFVSPPAGVYQLLVSDVTAAGVTTRPDFFNVTILPGAPVALTVQSPASLTAVRTAANVVLPTITIGLLDAGGGPVDPGTLDQPADRTVTATLVEASTLNPLPSAVFPSLVAYLDASGIATFSTITVYSPPIGSYLLRFESQLPIGTSIALTVLLGAASQLGFGSGSGLVATSTEILLSAALNTPIPPISLQAADVQGNPVLALDAAFSPRLVSADINVGGPALLGPTAVNMSNGAVTFISLSLTAPTVPLGARSALYYLAFSTVGLSSLQATLRVVPGAVANITVLNPIADSALPLLQETGSTTPLAWVPQVQLLDAVGNWVLQSGTFITASFCCAPGCSVCPANVLLLQSSLVYRSLPTSQEGLAVFSLLELSGTSGVLYTLQFSVPSLPAVAPVVSGQVQIRACQPTLAPLFDHCECDVGYYLAPASGSDPAYCRSCPANLYSDTVGNSASCTSCLPNKITNSTGSSNALDCFCRPGYFSLTPDANCQPCLQGATCSGGTAIEASPGFWRDGSTLNFIECTGQACLGGPNSDCAVGFEGPLCAVCSDGYGGFGDANCDRCSSSSSGYVVLIFFFAVGTAAYLVKLIEDFVLRPSSDRQSLPPVVLFKLWINFFQQVGFLAAFRMPWPKAMSLLFQFFSIFTLSAHIQPIQCAIKMSFYYNFLYYLLVPILLSVSVVALLVGLHFILGALGKLEGREAKEIELAMPFKQRALHYALLSFLLCMFVMHPAISQQVFEVYSCTGVAGEELLAADLTLHCGTPVHHFWQVIGALLLVFYCFGLPVFAVYWLIRKRYRMREAEFSFKFMFLYDGYVSKWYFWESVAVLRRVLLVLILVWARSSPYTQAVLGLLLFSVSAALQLHYEPYSRSLYQHVDFASLVVAYMTLLFGVLYRSDDILGKRLSLDFFLLLLNAVMMAVFLLLIIYNLLPKQHRDQIDVKFDRFFVSRGRGKSVASPDDAIVMTRAARSESQTSGDNVVMLFANRNRGGKQQHAPPSEL